MKQKSKKPDFIYPKKKDASAILEFIVTNPVGENEKVGEKLALNVDGEYHSGDRKRRYNLIFLLDHPAHYRVSRVLMQEIKYSLPEDRERNWFPTTHPENLKFVVV